MHSSRSVRVLCFQFILMTFACESSTTTKTRDEAPIGERDSSVPDEHDASLPGERDSSVPGTQDAGESDVPDGSILGPISCTENSECPDGTTCEDGRCFGCGPENDFQCDEGFICLGGRCLAGECLADQQCDDGFVCEQLHCIESCAVPNGTECLEHGKCEAGHCVAGCEKSIDCPSSQICGLSDDDRVVLHCVPAQCEQNADCKQDGLCLYGLCIFPTGQSCSNSTGCTDSLCYGEHGCARGPYLCDAKACPQGMTCDPSNLVCDPS